MCVPAVRPKFLAEPATNTCRTPLVERPTLASGTLWLMNRHDLVELLTRERVNPATYVIRTGDALTRPSADLEERSVLEIRDGGWLVYYRELGQETSPKWHETEDDACRDLLDRLLQDPTTRARE